MAVHAANFTPTTQSKPSIFEVFAQKSLNDVLYPALQKVALFVYSLNPQKYSWVCNYYDEEFLVLNGVLQWHYLKNYDATFSENFYGLKRLLINNESFDNYHRILSLTYIIILPYFKRKLEEKLITYRLQNAEGSLEKGYVGKLKKLLVFAQSMFEITWGLWSIITYLKYMSNQRESPLPLLHLLNMKLIYAQPTEDLSFWSSLFRGQLGLSDVNLGLIRRAATGMLEVTAFFMQFLQIWNAQVSNYNVTALPRTPAPRPDAKSANFEGKCPICKQFWKLPTVLPVSGYVFCFPCILKYLREFQKCPVTNLPAKPLDIIRIYDSV